MTQRESSTGYHGEVGMKRQEIYGGFEVVNMRLELNSTFTIDKPTFISQLSFNTYDTLISYLL